MLISSRQMTDSIQENIKFQVIRRVVRNRGWTYWDQCFLSVFQKKIDTLIFWGPYIKNELFLDDFVPFSSPQARNFDIFALLLHFCYDLERFRTDF